MGNASETDYLETHIEYLSPTLFIPRNEEELILNIVNLSQELRTAKDLPQVMISFQEQRHDVLKFNVILVRALSNSDPSLFELSKQLPQNVHFLPERIANVGYIRKKIVKEANMFSLEVENQLFLRKNHSVDLVKARQYVVKQLETMIGNFRDFNESFLLKQSRQLEEIKNELGLKGKHTEFLLENLFCSFSPSTVATSISKEQAKEISLLFLNCLEISRSCHLEFKQQANTVMFVLKTTISDVKDKLSSVLKNLQIDPLKLAQATVEVDRFYYICYLLFSNKSELSNAFIKLVQETVRSWHTQKQNLQTLRLHLPRAAQSLDPRIACDRTSGIVIKMLYEGLMRTNEKGEIENAIAEEVKISENWKKYLFKLKKTFWSNGSPLTAYDFEYAWKKVLEPDFRSPYSILFFSIKNAEAAKRGEIPVKALGVKALDESTLSVELEHPAKYFLELTSSWAFSPLCREIDQKHPGWAYHSGSSHVCNGPFKLDFWKINDDLHVIKNPFYWDIENVHLDRIQMTVIEDEHKSLKMFMQDELDWIGDPLTKIPVSAIKEFNQKGQIQTEDAYYGLFWLQLNTKKPPLQNAKIRKALSYAINRKALIDKVLHSRDMEAFGFFHPPDLSKLPFPDGDVHKAKELFEEGLKELKVAKEDLPLFEMTHSEIEEQELVTREIGRVWNEIFGVKVKYEKLLWNSYFEKLHSEDFMLGGLVSYPRFEDSMYYFNLFIFREEAVHITNWKKIEFNQLVEKAKETLDEKTKLFYLGKCEKMLLEEMPAIPLFYQKFRYVKNPKLKGYIFSNINQIDFRKAYKESE